MQMDHYLSQQRTVTTETRKKHLAVLTLCFIDFGIRFSGAFIKHTVDEKKEI